MNCVFLNQIVLFSTVIVQQIPSMLLSGETESNYMQPCNCWQELFCFTYLGLNFILFCNRIPSQILSGRTFLARRMMTIK